MGIEENASYELKGDTRYGSISYDNNKFNVTRRIQENNSLEIIGIMGNDASPKSKVKIETNYTWVQLIK